MDIHQNARTTAHSRAELVRPVTAGEGTAGKFRCSKREQMHPRPLAELPHAERIALKMARLCSKLGSYAQWNQREHRLEITVA